MQKRAYGSDTHFYQRLRTPGKRAGGIRRKALCAGRAVETALHHEGSGSLPVSLCPFQEKQAKQNKIKMPRVFYDSPYRAWRGDGSVFVLLDSGFGQLSAAHSPSPGGCRLPAVLGTLVCRLQGARVPARAETGPTPRAGSRRGAFFPATRGPGAGWR